MTRPLAIFPLLLFVLASSLSSSNETPQDFGEFIEVGVVDTEATKLTLDSATIDLINCGCTPCPTAPKTCPTPTGAPPNKGTYLYFPSVIKRDGNTKKYLVPEGSIHINRNSSLYLAGADQFMTELWIPPSEIPTDQPTAPMFEVIAAPLINISNLSIRPDSENYNDMNNRYADGPLSFHFIDPVDFEGPDPRRYMGATKFEMRDTRLDIAKVKIQAGGSYRFQSVTASIAGALDSAIEIDHPDADVIVVGGILFSLAAQHRFTAPAGSTTAIMSTCLSFNESTPSSDVCACGTDGCDLDELNSIRSDMCGDELSICHNPCGCDAYMVWAKQGRLRMFGTAMTDTDGTADIRIDSETTEPHTLAFLRSEGGKCGTSLESTLLEVPPTDRKVDVVLLANEGDWIHSRDYCPEVQQGTHTFANYNGAGTLWLLGNQGIQGVGRLVDGIAPAATVVAAGNQVHGNVTEPGGDPRNILPVIATKIAVGNIWSRGNYCLGNNPPPPASQNPECQVVPVGAECAKSGDPGCQPLSCHQASGNPAVCDPWTDFVQPDIGFKDFSNVPEFPSTDIPLPLRPITVNVATPNMVDAHAECLPAPGCVDFYPAGCTPNEGVYSNECWLQAGLNKAIKESRPLFIKAGHYLLDDTLYWIHANQTANQGFALPSRLFYPGGWIIGGENGVTLETTSNIPVFATEGMDYGVIQGIHFKSPAFDGSQTQSTVEIENSASLTTRTTAHVSFLDCSFTGGKNAFGLCVGSETQCDTILTAGGTFSDAETGWANGGANALHTLAYDATFIDNKVAIGHNSDTGRGNFGVLHGKVNATDAAKDLNLWGSNHPTYIYGLTSTNRSTLNETFVQNRQWPIVFDECELAAGRPYDPSTRLVEMGQGAGVMFLNSNLHNGVVELANIGEPSGGGTRVAMKIQTEANYWQNTVLAADVSQQRSREFEFETCPTDDLLSNPADCEQMECAKTIQLSSTQCLNSRGSWEVARPGEALELHSCECTP